MTFILYLAFGLALAIHGATGYNSTKLRGKMLSGLIEDERPAVIGGAAHECYRECVAGDTRICNYEFTVLEYATMAKACGDCPYNKTECYTRGCITAGGEVRDVKVVNHMLPGPSIQVCEGDTIRVKMVNNFGSDAASVHWHGMTQFNTSYMDGVAMLTQCPIHPGNSFVYDFIADPIGTHMWHSHLGIQEPDGFFGSLVVRGANDTLAQYYDYDLPEHIITMWHWYPESTSSVIKSTFFDSVVAAGHSIIINGMTATLNYTLDGVNYTTPRANFTVKQGYRYRFRLIGNMGIYCPIQFSVNNHTLLVIASDGSAVKPIVVDSMVMNAGERYDAVMEANNTIGCYLMKVRGLGNCATNWTFTTATVCYEGANVTDPSKSVTYAETQRSGKMLNLVGLTSTFPNNTCLQISDLENASDDAVDVSGEPDYTFYFTLSLLEYTKFETPGPWAQLNRVSFELPPVPLLTQYDDVTDDMYCSQGNNSNADCSDDYCTCPMVYAVELGSLVEMVLFDNSTLGDDSHPMHMHGGYFRVLAMETGDGSMTLDDVKARNENGSITKNYETGPQKDSISVPAHGFAVLRFRADNAGTWFMHCHVTAHTEEGMGVVFRVGNSSQIAQPPSDFPRCGNYDMTSSS